MNDYQVILLLLYYEIINIPEIYIEREDIHMQHNEKNEARLNCIGVSCFQTKQSQKQHCH